MNEPKIVECEFCKREILALKDRESGWIHGKPTHWCCDDCKEESERAFRASNFDVDKRESELAEFEY